MEDRVEFEGKNFRVFTETGAKNRIETTIELEQEQGNRILHQQNRIFKSKPEKEELMKFHNKALSLLFKILQKDSNPDAKSFDEEEKEDKIPSQEKGPAGSEEVLTSDNGQFSTICSELLGNKQLACFLSKDDELYSYFNNEPGEMNEDLILNISTTIDFIKDNKNIEKLIGDWHLMLRSEKSFNLYASVIGEEDVLIIINDPMLPVGSMLNTNEKIKEKLIGKFY